MSLSLSFRYSAQCGSGRQCVVVDVVVVVVVVPGKSICMGKAWQAKVRKNCGLWMRSA